VPPLDAAAPAHRGDDARRRVGSLLGGNDQLDTAKSKLFQEAGSNGFAISNPKLIRKNALIGTFDLELPAGMIIRGVMLLEKSGWRWVNFPSKEWSRPDGTKSYLPLIEFASPEIRDRFQAQVLPLAERALLGGQP
jgi:hypothetical protein